VLMTQRTEDPCLWCWVLPDGVLRADLDVSLEPAAHRGDAVLHQQTSGEPGASCDGRRRESWTTGAMVHDSCVPSSGRPKLEPGRSSPSVAGPNGSVWVPLTLQMPMDSSHSVTKG